MCEFCKEKQHLMNYNNISAEIEENFITVRVYSIKSFLQSFEINYCPMCGSKLINPDKEVI